MTRKEEIRGQYLQKIALGEKRDPLTQAMFNPELADYYRLKLEELEEGVDDDGMPTNEAPKAKKKKAAKKKPAAQEADDD